MKKRLHRASEAVAEQTSVYWSMAVWCIRALMVLTFATRGLQAQHQPQAAQSPEEENRQQ